MIEVLMSCANPHEIMTGKLIGVVGLALVTLSGWAAMAFLMAISVSGEALGVIATGLASLLPMLPLILLYFLCGLMIYCTIFLGIGATSASLPDAQALVGPASMIIVMPNMLLGAIRIAGANRRDGMLNSTRTIALGVVLLLAVGACRGPSVGLAPDLSFWVDCPRLSDRDQIKL